ncbi:MAG: tRNA (adenosine(37)-N6)-threonylcarbamoyltransferase complex dimerization subunit type 1 TsaB [Actinomycetota bacterium]|nr:tRNA (adenosine(37)-N6)-threonylcarbamoyltransferase complex dimerization subunit type 1 TsaB [Actinomycetota bacterium]
MLILGIETATPQVGCALGAHEGVLASFHASKGRRHAETLAPAIEFICRQARMDLGDVGAVAVDVGPGLFTGLRVGVVTAKALAMALRVPVVGISSLDLLAFPVRWTHRRIVSVVDARRGEVFYGFYRQVPGGVQRVSEHRVASPDELSSEILASGEDCLAVGDGALRYADRLAGLIGVDVAEAGLAYPSAASLVQLAHARALREDFVNSWELAPVYLRRADAEIDWRDRIRVRPGAGTEPAP